MDEIELTNIDARNNQARSLALLDRVAEEQELTDKQKARLELYNNIFTDYAQGLNVTELAKKYGQSRPTIYNALEFFRHSELVTDKNVNLVVSLHRIRKRLKRLEERVNGEDAKQNPSMKFISAMYSEIRRNEEYEAKILGLMTESKDAGGKDKRIIILQNIRGNVEQQVQDDNQS